MKLNSQRSLLLISAGVGLTALALALIAQYGFAIEPCAWCVLQRLIYFVIAIVALIGAYGGHRTVGRLAAALSTLLAVAGMATAWYQATVASTMLSCKQTFADRLISSTGLDATLPWLFGIYANCSDAAGSFLGVNYALWSLALFVVLFLLGLSALLRRP